MKQPAKAFYRIFRDVGVLGYSRKKNIFGMNPLLVSTLFLVLTAALAKLLRKAVKTTVTDGFVTQLCMEFLATAELCAACFELAVIADNFGVWVYALYLFLLCIWWSKAWENASACPYTPMEEVLDGCQNIRDAILIIISQLLGGYVIFRYVQALWSLQLAETHIGKVNEECSADLQVPMMCGAVVEGVATCLCRLSSKFLSDVQAKYSHIVDPFFATMMVVAAFNFSGGYFNPALATSLKFGCDGQTFSEFMFVYWFGACFGAISSVFIYDTAPMKRIVGYFKQKGAKKED